jgi:hypothetical protein
MPLEKKVIMPTNDTRYFLNKESIVEAWHKALKDDVHTPTIDSFNINCSNPESQ